MPVAEFVFDHGGVIEGLQLFLAEMEAKAVDIAFVVRETFGTGCFIRDCTGNLIEFVEEAEY